MHTFMTVRLNVTILHWIFMRHHYICEKHSKTDEQKTAGFWNGLGLQIYWRPSVILTMVMFCYPPYVSSYWPSPLQLHVTSIPDWPVANHALLLRNLSDRAELQLITVIKLSLFDSKLNNHQWLLLECELGILQILSRTPKDDAVELVNYSSLLTTYYNDYF